MWNKSPTNKFLNLIIHISIVSIVSIYSSPLNMAMELDEVITLGELAMGLSLA